MRCHDSCLATEDKLPESLLTVTELNLVEPSITNTQTTKTASIAQSGQKRFITSNCKKQI